MSVRTDLLHDRKAIEARLATKKTEISVLERKREGLNKLLADVQTKLSNRHTERCSIERELLDNDAKLAIDRLPPRPGGSHHGRRARQGSADIPGPTQADESVDKPAMDATRVDDPGDARPSDPAGQEGGEGCLITTTERSSTAPSPSTTSSG